MLRRVIVELQMDVPDVLTENMQRSIVGNITNGIPLEIELGNDEYATIGNSGVTFLPIGDKTKTNDLANPFEDISVKVAQPPSKLTHDDYVAQTRYEAALAGNMNDCY